MLSNRDQLALIMIGEIVKSESAVTLQSICDSIDYSISYIEKVAGELRRKGVIEGIRGPGGGYIIAKDMSNIPLTDVIFTSQRPLQPLAKDLLIERSEWFIREYMKNASLGDLLRKFSGATSA